MFSWFRGQEQEAAAGVELYLSWFAIEHCH